MSRAQQLTARRARGPRPQTLLDGCAELLARGGGEDMPTAPIDRIGPPLGQAGGLEIVSRRGQPLPS
jgi:hypothetical protein